jgi:hypothetical protein
MSRSVTADMLVASIFWPDASWVQTRPIQSHRRVLHDGSPCYMNMSSTALDRIGDLPASSSIHSPRPGFPHASTRYRNVSKRPGQENENRIAVVGLGANANHQALRPTCPRPAATCSYCMTSRFWETGNVPKPEGVSLISMPPLTLLQPPHYIVATALYEPHFGATKTAMRRGLAFELCSAYPVVKQVVPARDCRAHETSLHPIFHSSMIYGLASGASD